MKKFLFYISFLVLIFIQYNLMAATRSVSSSRRRIVQTNTTKLATPTELDCKENIDYCFNRFCFDKKTLTNGVYSKCGTISASQIQINVEDCLDTRGIIKELDLNKGCKNYTYTYIVNLLANKDVIEKGLKKNTKECQVASKALDAAKACWAIMISHDGSIDASLKNTLNATCGYSVSGDMLMADRFYNAGNYGDANLGAQIDLQLSGQNTQKRENWRQVVDAVLVGYMELAELSCGEEDYSLTKVNNYQLDNHDNLEMIRLKSQATQVGKSMANKIVNSWFRMTDCLNSPLPLGGERWEYVEDGAPDCRLVCASGYQRGKDSSECVKIELASTDFVGFNLGAGGKVSVGANSSIATINNNVDAGASSSSSNVSYPDNGGCSKALPKLNYSQTKEGICRVFFPQCSSSSLGTKRWYSRNTDSAEFFCVGDNSGFYDYHVLISMDIINSVFGTNFVKFGNGYSTDASLYLYQNCAKYCGGDIGNNSSIKPVAICLNLPEAKDTETVRNAWLDVLNTYSFPTCKNGEVEALLYSLQNYGKSVRVSNYLYGGNSSSASNTSGTRQVSNYLSGNSGDIGKHEPVYISGLNDGVLNNMQRVRDCVCGTSLANKSNTSSSVSYEMCSHSLSDVNYTDVNSMTMWYSYTSKYNGNCSNNPKSDILDYVRVLEMKSGKKYTGSEEELEYINIIKNKLPSFYSCVCG